MIDAVDQPDEQQDEPIRLDAIVPKAVGTNSRRIPTTKEWVKFSDAYSFMEVQVWVDAPARVMEGLSPQRPDETPDELRSRILETLGQIVLAHRFDDGTPWADDDGELPPPQDAAFWDRAPQPIVNAIVNYIKDRIQMHPTLRRSSGTPRR